MKYLIVACKVFEKEIEKILENHKHRLIMLDFGYHKMPFVLQQKLQEVINNAVGVDAILLLYGYCGGILKLTAGSIPVVMPRAHDCFDIMLGNKERYALFTEEPGTYFLSEGWVKRDGTPAEKVKGIEKRLEGDKNGLIHEMYSGYKRLLFVRTGVESDESIRRARLASNEMNWRFEEKNTDIAMVKKLFSREWDSEFIVLKPENKS